MKKAGTSSGGAADEILLKAADKGDLKSVRERLAAGIDINAAPKNGCPAILVAVKRGHLKVVQALMEAGADINCVGFPPGESLKSSPLSCAMEHDNWEIVDALLKAGADIAAEPIRGDNAVGEAASRASRHYYTLAAPEKEWLGDKRTKAVLQEARAKYDRCMQFIRDAIAKGVKVRDYYLWNAVNSKHAELVLLLVSAGVNPNVAPHGSSALVRAIEHGEDEIALELVKAGADANLLGGNLPLLVAAEKGNTRIAAALLDAGANIDAAGDTTIGEDDELEVPTKSAAADIVKKLIKRVDQRGVVEAGTPLIVATRSGDEAMVKLLVERGADTSITDKQGVTALAWATRLNDRAIVELLKKAGAKKPEFLEGSIATALWAAAKNGDAARVRELLSRGAKPDVVVEDREGKHLALVSAAKEGHLEVVQLLIQRGANVNAGAQVSLTGNITPLMAAAKAGRVEVIKALLGAKADLGVKDIGPNSNSETALHYAARGGSAGAIQALLAGGAEINTKARGGRTPLCVAAAEKKFDAAKALIDAGADINSGPSDGLGPVACAAMSDDLELVKLLIARGAEVRVRSARGNTLSWAAWNGSIEMVDFLLKAGAPINSFGGRGSTPLDHAAFKGHGAVVKMLLAAGANPNLADLQGFTPLMAAVRIHNEAIARLLLEAGADPNAEFDGRSVLKIAREGKKKNIIALIEAAAKARPAPKVFAKKAAPTPKRRVKEEEEEEFEAPDFSEAAESAEFQAALREVEKLCGIKPEPLGDIGGGFSFSVPHAVGEKLIAEHHQRLLKKGAYFFRHHRDYRKVQDKLGLLPTREWSDLIRVFQTNGGNYDLMPDDIAKWLQKLSPQQPFVITGAGWDWLEGRFTSTIKSPRKLAHQMYEFCPDIVDQGVGSVKDLARLLEKDEYFFFWWD